MKNKSLSVGAIIEKALKKLDNKALKVFSVSLLYSLIFVVSYLLTGSVVVSSIAYLFFYAGYILCVNKIANGENSKVEEMFYIQKSSLTILLVMAFFVAVTGIGLALLIVPGVLFLVNFSFVSLNYNEDKNKSVFDYYKQAHEEVKGYRGKMLWLILIFLFTAILLSGLGILVAFLLSLIFPIVRIFMWTSGVGVGLFLFAVLVLPILSVSLAELRNAILKDKEEKPLTETTKKSKKSQPKGKDEEDAVIVPEEDKIVVEETSKSDEE